MTIKKYLRKHTNHYKASARRCIEQLLAKDDNGTLEDEYQQLLQTPPKKPDEFDDFAKTYIGWWTSALQQTNDFLASKDLNEAERDNAEAFKNECFGRLLLNSLKPDELKDVEAEVGPPGGTPNHFSTPRVQLILEMVLQDVIRVAKSPSDARRTPRRT